MDRDIRGLILRMEERLVVSTLLAQVFAHEIVAAFEFFPPLPAELVTRWSFS
jgi:hypothetical protein